MTLIFIWLAAIYLHVWLSALMGWNLTSVIVVVSLVVCIVLRFITLWRRTPD